MIGTCSSDDVTAELEWDKANNHNPIRVEAVVSPAEDEDNDDNCDEVLELWRTTTTAVGDASRGTESMSELKSNDVHATSSSEYLIGKPAEGILTNFGRQVLYYKSSSYASRGGLMDKRWGVGTWLGKSWRQDAQSTMVTRWWKQEQLGRCQQMRHGRLIRCVALERHRGGCDQEEKRTTRRRCQK